MTNPAPIIDSFESLQAAVAGFLKIARNGGCEMLSDDDLQNETTRHEGASRSTRSP